jgi:sugar phosphate isomerase/epimerase
MTTRRTFITGAGTVLFAAAAGGLAEAALPPKSPLGVASTAMSLHLSGAGGAAKPMREDSLAYIDYCRSLGAGGVQFTPTGDLKKVRARLEQLGMWFEGEARPPGHLDEDTAAFEQSLANTKACGGNVVRMVSRPPAGSSGRRYESFKSLEEYKAWLAEANAIVLKLLPLAKKHGVRLALENHKDRTVDEHVEFLQKTSDEYLGALVDPGNPVALCEDPFEVAAKLSPYVLSCSLKDMGVAPYEDGFLLSEVLFGDGIYDQAKIFAILRKGNPKLNPQQEIITRDPLKVPCLTAGYWATYPHRPATELARMMTTARAHASKLPYVSQLSPAERLQAEEDNNRKTFDWGRTHLA